MIAVNKISKFEDDMLRYSHGKSNVVFRMFCFRLQSLIPFVQVGSI